MQTMEIEDYALRARANKAQRMIAKGYSLSAQDVDWIRGLAERLGVSESQVLRGVLAAARENEGTKNELNELEDRKIRIPPPPPIPFPCDPMELIAILARSIQETEKSRPRPSLDDVEIGESF